jgi:large subunit ribosomal protein L35
MKLKTKKAAAKRFRFSATGKVKFTKSGRRHLLSKKSNVKMLGIRGGAYMTDGDAKHVRKCMPYGEA